MTHNDLEYTKNYFLLLHLVACISLRIPWVNTAQIIILLLSAEFVASNYCSSNEMKRAIERHERGEIHIIPIIVRPVLWELVLIPVHKLHILPKNGKPITDPFWVTQDRAFHEITKGIYDIVEELIKKIYHD